jgi:hypothetical protein
MEFRPIDPTKTPRRLRTPRTPVYVLALLAAFFIVPVAGEGDMQSRQNDLAVTPAANAVTAANTKAPLENPEPAKPAVDAVKAEQEKQIADDSARLLKLATDLKAEVDKSTKDTLSITVIRKADEIERLARNVREKARPTVTPM